VQRNEIDTSNTEIIAVCGGNVPDVNYDKRALSGVRISPSGEKAVKLMNTESSRTSKDNPSSLQYGEADSTELKGENRESHVDKGDSSEDNISSKENSTVENPPSEENAKGEEDAQSESSETSEIVIVDDSSSIFKSIRHKRDEGAKNKYLEKLMSMTGLEQVEDVVDDSPSRLEWIRQKRDEGAINKHLDLLMSMIGLEDVKAQFLKIKARVEIAKRQGVDLSKERFNVVLVGNPGTGEFLSKIPQKPLL
jgi:hypothetical protein